MLFFHRNVARHLVNECFAVLSPAPVFGLGKSLMSWFIPNHSERGDLSGMGIVDAAGNVTVRVDGLGST